MDYQVEELPITAISVSDFNTRKDLSAGGEDSSIEDLADSIRQQGLLSPILVRPKGSSWEIIAGQRRFRACQALGWTKIPCIVRADMTDSDATTVSLIENVHRADMHPLDKARSLQALSNSLGSIGAVAKETGIGEQTIRRYLDLMKLPAQLQNELSTAKGHIGVEALSTLARSFGDSADALEAYEAARGFNSNVQQHIFKTSEGNLDRLMELAIQAREGLFDVRTCRFGFCEHMTPEVKFAFRGAIEEDGLSVSKLTANLSPLLNAGTEHPVS